MIFNLERFLNHVSFASSTPTPKVLIPLIPLVLNSRMPCPGQDSCSPPLGTNRWIRCQAPYIGRSCPSSDTTFRTAAIWRRRISRGRSFSEPCEYVSGITLTVVSCLRLAPACPCDCMLHAQVCARQRLHTFSLVARPKTAPRWKGLSLRAYAPRSGVCT